MTVPAGYSGTPLPKKLGIRPGDRVLLDAAPVGFDTDTLGALPDGVVLHRRAGRAPYDVVVVFRDDATTPRRTAGTSTATSPAPWHRPVGCGSRGRRRPAASSPT